MNKPMKDAAKIMKPVAKPMPVSKGKGEGRSEKRAGGSMIKKVTPKGYCGHY